MCGSHLALLKLMSETIKQDVWVRNFVTVGVYPSPSQGGREERGDGNLTVGAYVAMTISVSRELTYRGEKMGMREAKSLCQFKSRIDWSIRHLDNPDEERWQQEHRERPHGCTAHPAHSCWASKRPTKGKTIKTSTSSIISHSFV